MGAAGTAAGVGTAAAGAAVGVGAAGTAAGVGAAAGMGVGVLFLGFSIKLATAGVG